MNDYRRPAITSSPICQDLRRDRFVLDAFVRAVNPVDRGRQDRHRPRRGCSGLTTTTTTTSTPDVNDYFPDVDYFLCYDYVDYFHDFDDFVYFLFNVYFFHVSKTPTLPRRSPLFTCAPKP